jgi:DNA (cytosine-5)-methyltransferase 1
LIPHEQPVVIDRAAFNQGQNAQYEPHIEHTEIMDTVVARGPHAVGIPLSVVEPQLYENRPTDSRITGPHDVSPTMTSRFGTGGGNIPLVQHHMPGSVAPTVTSSGPPYSRTGNERVEAEALAITFQPGNLRREAGADPSTTTTTTLKASAGDQMPHVAYPAAGFKWHQGSQAGSIGYEEQVSPTITTDKSPGVIHSAYPVVPLDDMNLLSRLGPCGEKHSIQNFTPGDPMFTLKKGGDQHGVLTPMAVRRLTPVECERLQGFPDNWSQIPWKGKPAEQCPDGPRYKCAGNSMAVPVMRWIGEQIARVELSTQQPK